jgi:hypothetical protein
MIKRPVEIPVANPQKIFRPRNESAPVVPFNPIKAHAMGFPISPAMPLIKKVVPTRYPIFLMSDIPATRAGMMAEKTPSGTPYRTAKAITPSVLAAAGTQKARASTVP